MNEQRSGRCPALGLPYVMALSFGFFVCFSHAQNLPPEVAHYADTVFFNGHVLTMDSDKPPFTVAKALAVRDGKVLAVGDDDRIVKMAGPNTVKVDLRGKAVMPGFIDTHAHSNSYALMHRDREQEVTPAYVKFLRDNHVRLASVNWESKEKLLADFKRLADSLAPGEWIFTSAGLSEAIHERWKEITRYDLDKVAPNNPLFIRIGNSAWGTVNTKMMEVVKGIYGEQLLPGFLKDAQGVATGRLFGAAGEAIDQEVIPQMPPEIIAPAFKKELEEWVAFGVTTLSTRLKGREISAYTLLDRKGELPLRLPYSHEIARSNHLLERDLRRLGNLQGHGTDRIWLIGLSVGNPDGNGPGAPEGNGSDCSSLPKRETLPGDFWPEGICFWELPGAPGRDGAIIANRYGYRVSGVHNFGDKASLMSLASYEKANQEGTIQDKRFALDHGMMVSPEVIKQAAKLGVMFSLQPPLFYAFEAAAVGRVYGEDIAHRWVMPVKSLIDAGVKVAYGADSHRDPDRQPLFNLQVLVTRKVKDGRVFGNREKIDRSTALLMMTRWGAEYVLREKEIGSLEVGKLADLILLDKNPLDGNVPDESLSQIKVLATMVGGKLAYGSLGLGK